MTRSAPGVVLSLDNVPVRLLVAKAGSRALAASLDYLLWAIAQAVLALAVLGLAVTAPSLVGGTLAIVYAALAFLLDWAFFALQEASTGGRTVGKRAVGLRVVSAEGGPAGRGALVLRNIVRSIDLLLGMPLMVLDPGARRLGDRLAGTLVVFERNQVAGEAVRRSPRGWGLEEASLVEDLLARLDTLEPERARYLCERLLARAAAQDADFLWDVPDVLEPVTRARLAFTGGHVNGPGVAPASVSDS